MTASHFTRDIQDLLALLFKHKVRYLVVGAEAVIFHGFARFTGDIDIFYEPTPRNCRPLFLALQAFWRGDVPGIKKAADLENVGTIIQFGYPPSRIDLINSISGVGFAEAWKGRCRQAVLIRKRTVQVNYIGLSELIKNKKACARPKDLEDLRYLREKAISEARRAKKRSSNRRQR